MKNSQTSLTVASNYSNIIDIASDIWTQSQEKYRAGAFLHWYWKHGCDEVALSINFVRTNLHTNTS